MVLELQTKQFKEHVDKLRVRYEQNNPPENKKDKQFFLMVKEYTAPIYVLLEEWEKNTLQVVKDRKVNIHPQQVTSTRENMELLLMHSFYIDAKRKRYMELNHSVLYVLDQLLRELNNM
ncbi:protein of unknown function [Virgibacillus subterraneus]|uniref:DUF1798 family protein n=2 Tax=Virgibacillus TaxID=84406 RepID=A0A1H1BTY5_9BACI|nr:MULTISPECIES: DUF1798 family protein [Virgibacillus]SDQ55359.1 protein of unknown function [Virgibacillus salinus]SEQ27006.1 protein of unknown function [Virgibacillus subterraneus]